MFINQKCVKWEQPRPTTPRCGTEKRSLFVPSTWKCLHKKETRRCRDVYKSNLDYLSFAGNKGDLNFLHKLTRQHRLLHRVCRQNLKWVGWITHEGYSPLHNSKWFQFFNRLFFLAPPIHCLIEDLYIFIRNVLLVFQWKALHVYFLYD